LQHRSTTRASHARRAMVRATAEGGDA
jgi:hypothetical protein